MARISNLSRAELEDGLFTGRGNRAPAPQKSITPVPAPMQAPATVTPEYALKGVSLDDYLAQQQKAFTPQVIRSVTATGGESGYEPGYDIYSQFDPYKATQDYIKQRDTARTGLTPTMSRSLSGMANYDQYTNKLAKEIGYAGPKTFSYTGKASSGAANENGDVYTAPTLTELHPDFLDALSGYKIENAIIGSNDPAVNIYKPDGSLMGKYRVGNNSENSFDRVAEAAIPALISGVTGGALAGPLLGALGITAPGAIATGIATGGIGGGVNAGIQGGNILEGILKGGLSGGIGGGVTSGINAIAPGAISKVTDVLQSVGVPEDLAMRLAEYTKPALVGGATSLFTGGNPLEGLAGGALGGVIGDVGSKLGLTPGQSSALGQYLIDGNEAKLAVSLGNGLARSAISAVKNADNGSNYGSFGSGSAGYNLPSIDNELGFANYEPTPQQVEVSGVRPSTGIDYGNYFNSLPQDIYNTIPGIYTPQRVEVTGQAPKQEQENIFSYLPSISGETSDITLGAKDNKVEVVGKKPVDEEFNLPSYVYEIPKLAPMPIPEVPTTTAPKPTASALTPAPQNNSTDMSGLFNLLAMNQQQPVPSQVLANMPGFNVEREMSGYRQEQQPDLAALLTAIGYKG